MILSCSLYVQVFGAVGLLLCIAYFRKVAFGRPDIRMTVVSFSIALVVALWACRIAAERLCPV